MRGQRAGVRRQQLKFCILYSVFCILFFATGCENDGSGKMFLAKQVDKLNKEKAELLKQIEQVKTENEALRSQLQTLTSVPEQVNVKFQVLAGLAEQIKFEDIYHLSRIKIHRYTDLYDDNGDGKKEKLKVYIQPIDYDGDIIKAPGAVIVQLWDLSKEKEQALLGEWKVGPEQLKKCWYSTLITHYKLEFDVADKIGEFKDPLTVSVTFIDYLTATAFNEQEVIRP
jgi:hypothetical protein